MSKLRVVVSTVLCKAGAWRVHIGFAVMDDAVKLPPSRNGSQIVLSLNTNIFYATSVTVQWVGISYRGVSIARVLTAHTEIPAAMIAAVIAAVFQFTNALLIVVNEETADNTSSGTLGAPYHIGGWEIPWRR